uniref:Cytochrome c oxidase subunit 3 n=1 Tax=Acerella muscorum TaxID=187596 RepID=A0A0C4K2E6_9HEXA|nr:cytochrome c oxidase subunit III [Acerella muscorum]AHL42970.1 cytochrome c oxidase subunit III [Acerella muscorum]
MLMKNNHPFHMVDYSPWPFYLSIFIFLMMTGIIEFLFNKQIMILMVGFMGMLMILMQWWRDVSRESKIQGLHSKLIIKGMKMGMIMFIISEILFFMSFFWSFFHFSLVPNIELGSSWPPFNIKIFNFIEMPLLNTLILVSSGLTLTWSHKSLISNNYLMMMNSLMLTIMLGLYFTLLQVIEYKESSYSMFDSSFGSSFFMATGFHGIHVMMGSVFLLIMLFRMMKNSFSFYHHFGFEAASWYWHFVDVVWLFLYLVIYWWNSI